MLTSINTEIERRITGKTIDGYGMGDKTMQYHNMSISDLTSLRNDYERRVKKETDTASGLKNKVLIRL